MQGIGHRYGRAAGGAEDLSARGGVVVGRSTLVRDSWGQSLSQPG